MDFFIFNTLWVLAFSRNEAPPAPPNEADIMPVIKVTSWSVIEMAIDAIGIVCLVLFIVAVVGA